MLLGTCTTVSTLAALAASSVLTRDVCVCVEIMKEASVCCVCLWCKQQVQGVNGLVARWNYLGFTATPDSRQLRDIAGQQLQVGGGTARQQ
jgi:hypothetical protein